MARLIYTANALADLERLTDFLLESDPVAALQTIELIEEAVSILPRHPLDIHARGIANVVQNTDNREPKDRAFVLSAEMVLMQHTCHRFCKSKTVASARLMARHKTTHQQVVDAVSPETRREYVRLIGG